MLNLQRTRRQRTLARAVGVTGHGYWTGEKVRVEFRPAPECTGIVFVRGDLPQPARIPAVAAARIEIPRRTVLEHGPARVEMVEHALAALAGLQIDNCEIWLDRQELPGLDGSSQDYVDALTWAGVCAQQAPRAQLVISEVIRLGDEQSWIEARPAAGPGLSLRYVLDYGPRGPIGRQIKQIQLCPRIFREELAACRTFLLREEAEWLMAQGLGRRATLRDLLVFDTEGPVENTLRFPDECVRHKLLDMVGDLALAGCDLVGHVTAHRSGHRLNAELVSHLLARPPALRRSA
ncbi:MAG: UDP-3-O-acyl-N-acetylglucosamine deacetylase [Pirellulales bacterium]|nr:UDP-3-O-acyl-N-acetylglucosamine deacetylase [Pirellulales bacterium]